MAAKARKIILWTLGMAVAVYLITDGKGGSAHPLRHVLIGGAVGLVPGCVFSRNLK